jgi:hypothetical protein
VTAAVLCLLREVYGVQWKPSRVWGLFSGIVSANDAHSHAPQRCHRTVRLVVSEDVCWRQEKPVMLYRLDQPTQADVGTRFVSALMDLVVFLVARLARRLSMAELVLQSVPQSALGLLTQVHRRQ